MVWDLRNARAPEKVFQSLFEFFHNLTYDARKILTGYDKGVLSPSWCKQDADLLLSYGKDNRALCWDPQTSEIIGEVCFFIEGRCISSSKHLCSSQLPITGHSKWNGLLETPIYLPPHISMVPLEFTLYSLRTTQMSLNLVLCPLEGQMVPTFSTNHSLNRLLRRLSL